MVAKGCTMEQRKAVWNADVGCHGLNKMRAKWNGNGIIQSNYRSIFLLESMMICTLEFSFLLFSPIVFSIKIDEKT